MRAHSNSTTDFGSQFVSAAQAWSGRRGPPPELHEPAAIQANLAQQHRDLDDIIAVLSQYSPSDASLIQRLKKRKLHIKDEMVRVAGMPALLR
jgi:hypothetical protein